MHNDVPFCHSSRSAYDTMLSADATLRPGLSPASALAAVLTGVNGSAALAPLLTACLDACPCAYEPTSTSCKQSCARVRSQSQARCAPSTLSPHFKHLSAFCPLIRQHATSEHRESDQRAAPAPQPTRSMPRTAQQTLEECAPHTSSPVRHYRSPAPAAGSPSRPLAPPARAPARPANRRKLPRRWAARRSRSAACCSALCRLPACVPAADCHGLRRGAAVGGVGAMAGCGGRSMMSVRMPGICSPCKPHYAVTRMRSTHNTA